MLKFLLKDRVIESIINKLTGEVNKELGQFQEFQDKKFDTIIEHLEKLRFEVATIDKKVTQLEMKERMDYGQLKYQISALENKLKPNKVRPKRDNEQSH